MRRTALTSAAVAILFLVSAPMEASDKAEIDEKIKKAASYLDKPGEPGSDGKPVFQLLIVRDLETQSDDSAW